MTVHPIFVLTTAGLLLGLLRLPPSQSDELYPKLVTRLPCFARSVQFSSDDRQLATVGAGIQIWDTKTWRSQKLEGTDPPQFFNLALPPTSKHLFAAAESPTVLFWSLTMREERSYYRHRNNVCALAASGDGKLVASGDAEGTVKLWDVAAGREIGALAGRGRIQALAFSPDGNTLAGLGGTNAVPTFGALWLWDIPTKQIRKTIEFELPPICLAFSPDGRMLALAGRFFGHSIDLNIEICNADTGAAYWFTQAWTCPRSLVFSSDSRILLVAGGETDRRGFGHTRDSGEVKFFEMASRQEILTLHAHDVELESIALSADNTLLAVTCDGQTKPINVWDVRRLLGTQRDRNPAASLTLDELEKHWESLANKSATGAYVAISSLVQSPWQAVFFLDQRLTIAPRTDDQTIERLIADLDSDAFATREIANQRLADLNDLVAPALRRALAGRRSPEARRRIETLLGRVPPSHLLRSLRALGVLERIGTPEAVRVVRRLATGAPEARLTQEAKETLQRLEKRPG